MLAVAAGNAQVLKRNSIPEIMVVNGGKDIDTLSIERIVELYRSSQRRGFGNLGMPGFVVTGQSHNFLLGIGGNVAVRATYDFDGISDNKDFVTSAIPVPNNARERQQYLIDPTTSTLFFKSVIDSEKVGPITGYIEANFRGNNGTDFYLRKAYVTIGGFFIGRYYTSFCDTRAAPSTVDYEGPNYMPLIYRTMIQYNFHFGRGRNWSAGIAIESSNVSATTGSNFSIINQRMPDIPAYIQYEWNETRSHIRLAGVFRDMVYWNETEDARHFQAGWGVHLSGALQIGDKLTAYYGGLYGRGLGGYIQDISGLGLDLVYDSRNPEKMQALPMAGWNGGLQYTFDNKWVASAAYSGVKVFPNDGFRDAGAYTLGQYLSTNAFYHITDNCQVGASYMYGLRKNMDDRKGHANRIQAVIQYNF